jgi:hypothetical protein
MIAITTSSSTSVKARRELRFAKAEGTVESGIEETPYATDW